MSPKPSTEIQVADHERRLLDVEEALKGTENSPGLIKEVRDLREAGLVDTAKRAAVVAVVSLLITAAPLLGMVLPEVRALRDAIQHAPASGGRTP